MLKIDLHTHILPREWPDLSQRYGYDGFVRIEHDEPGAARMMQGDRLFRRIESDCWDLDERLAFCDRCGIDVQVLSTVPVMFCYWAKGEDAHDLSRILNDHLAECARKRPERFAALGTLPMQAPDLGVRELERCVLELGMPGVQIGSHVGGKNLNEPEVRPVLEAAQSLGAAIFVHPWDMLGRERMRDYWLPWLVGMPAEISLAVCSMIFGGVFEDLPALRVCFSHAGGAFPGTFGRIQHGFDVRPDIVARDNPRPPREYLGRFWVDSATHDQAMLRHVIDLFGDDKVAMGSDYPFPLGEHTPGACIECETSLSEQARARLLGGNALAFLDLPAERFAPASGGDRTEAERAS